MSTPAPHRETTAAAASPRPVSRRPRTTIMSWATGRDVLVPGWMDGYRLTDALALASGPGETGPDRPLSSVAAELLAELLADLTRETFHPAAESAYQAPWQPAHPCHRVHAAAPRAPSAAGRSAVAA